MTRMADDFERADRERDLLKHDFPPLEQPDDRGGNDLLLVALIVIGILGSLLIALGVLINHASHQSPHPNISFRIAIPHCHFVDSRQAADCTIKKLNDAADQ